MASLTKILGNEKNKNRIKNTLFVRKLTVIADADRPDSSLNTSDNQNNTTAKAESVNVSTPLAESEQAVSEPIAEISHIGAISNTEENAHASTLMKTEDKVETNIRQTEDKVSEQSVTSEQSGNNERTTREQPGNRDDHTREQPGNKPENNQ